MKHEVDFMAYEQVYVGYYGHVYRSGWKWVNIHGEEASIGFGNKGMGLKTMTPKHSLDIMTHDGERRNITLIINGEVVRFTINDEMTGAAMEVIS